jgi:serine/threonine protein kinase
VSGAIITPVSPAPGRAASAVRFGRFRLLRRIGAGDTAEVWQAESGGPEGQSRVYAVKRFGRDGRDGALESLFAADARPSGLLVHPNVTRVHEIGATGGCCYVAMELLDGADLGDVLCRLAAGDRRMPTQVAVYIAREIARGLEYVHGRTDELGRSLGLVHGDVSPGNVMLLRNGGLKVRDFGLARFVERLRRARPPGTLLRGKVPYRAPEQAAGGPGDARADVFALGTVLWEMLVMRPLFWESEPAVTAKNLLAAPVHLPSAIRRDIPPALDRVVMRALARDPVERYATAADLARALDRFVGDPARARGEMIRLVHEARGRLPDSAHWSVPPGPEALAAAHESSPGEEELSTRRPDAAAPGDGEPLTEPLLPSLPVSDEPGRRRSGTVPGWEPHAGAALEDGDMPTVVDLPRDRPGGAAADPTMRRPPQGTPEPPGAYLVTTHPPGEDVTERRRVQRMGSLIEWLIERVTLEARSQKVLAAKLAVVAFAAGALGATSVLVLQRVASPREPRPPAPAAAETRAPAPGPRARPLGPPELASPANETDPRAAEPLLAPPPPVVAPPTAERASARERPPAGADARRPSRATDDAGAGAQDPPKPRRRATAARTSRRDAREVDEAPAPAPRRNVANATPALAPRRPNPF